MPRLHYGLPGIKVIIREERFGWALLVRAVHIYQFSCTFLLRFLYNFDARTLAIGDLRLLKWFLRPNLLYQLSDLWSALLCRHHRLVFTLHILCTSVYGGCDPLRTILRHRALVLEEVLLASLESSLVCLSRLQPLMLYSNQYALGLPIVFPLCRNGEE